MWTPNRRRFLAQVGRGMLVAGVGSACVHEMGLVSRGDMIDGADPLDFGALEPLVALMQETPIDKLQPVLLEKHRNGTSLKTLTAAGALANARTFGGHDYVGYHALMALVPALQMSREMPGEQAPLPVLKVLYRNSHKIQVNGGRAAEMLHELHAAEELAEHHPELRQLVHELKYEEAEKALARKTMEDPREAYNDLQHIIQDDLNVHRVVLAWRAWDILRITGEEHALTMLRQSVRFCIDEELDVAKGTRAEPAIRKVLPKLMDRYNLAAGKSGTREGDDTWLEELAQVVYGGSREQAADAVASALADGYNPSQVGEAIALAANLLVLRDPGRQQGDAERPVGSVHGASVGVHASDAANAWRHIAGVSNPRNAMASLIVGAYHTAGQSRGQLDDAYPLAEHAAKVKANDKEGLLAELDDCVQQNDQSTAAAIVAAYGEAGHDARPVFDMFLRYAVSEDGALHAEKFYRTVAEEFAATRPSFRWRHLVALARVTASEHGFAAPGYDQAKQLVTG